MSAAVGGRGQTRFWAPESIVETRDVDKRTRTRESTFGDAGSLLGLPRGFLVASGGAATLEGAGHEGAASMEADAEGAEGAGASGGGAEAKPGA